MEYNVVTMSRPAVMSMAIAADYHIVELSACPLILWSLLHGISI